MRKQSNLTTFLWVCVALTIGGIFISSPYPALAQTDEARIPESLMISQVDPMQGTQAQYQLKDLVEMYSTPLAIIIPAIGGIFAYWMNESWKRRQYIEGKIRDFECKPETINARKLISSELQCIELFPFVEPPTHRYVIVEDCLWAEALLECKCNVTLKTEFSSINKDKPLYEQKAAVKSCIRDDLNRFLGYLQHFEKMIEAGAIDQSKLRVYIEPWIESISKVNEEVKVHCSSDGTDYTPKEALLGYMGLKQNIPEQSLSVVQRDVRALFSRYPLSLGKKSP